MSLAVVVAAAGECRSGPFWQAVAGWPMGAPEVHVIASDPASLGAAPPEVKVHAAPGGSTIFELWYAGLVHALADHVAILDIHCPPEPGWLDAVSSALSGDADCLFGPVAAPVERGAEAMLGYLVEYVQFHPPIDPAMNEIPGNNLIVRRSLALAAADSAATGFVKTALLPLLAAPPLQVAGCVRYGKLHGFPAYVRRRFDHGRTYAARRSRHPLRRLGFAALTPLLPLVRVGRIHGHARRDPDCARAFWGLLAAIIVAETSWSLGELVGYVAGAGGSARRLD